MLGRATYTKEELDSARAAIDAQLAAYRALAATATGKAKAALAAFDEQFFNNLTLALDRYFVHRVRAMTGKDTNPLSEVELLADSLMSNGGVLRTGAVVKYVPEKAVLQLQPGDPISLTAEQFERLASAFLGEIEQRFLAG